MPIDLTSESVSLGTGPPTREELLVYYPPKFTWDQLKTFVNSGDLGLLKRDRALQQRYNEWSVGIKQEYGTMVSYLLKHRLQWGKPDTISVLLSAHREGVSEDSEVPAPQYFTRDIPSKYISIIQNDWPYSVPVDIEHTLIWTKVPIYHPGIVDPSIAARIAQDGIWGFTGLTSPPPSPSTLSSCLPALSEWGVTEDKMIVSPKGTPEEEVLVEKVGVEVNEFVKRRWNEDEWETAWFVNPPRLQSIPDLAHIHVFARQKTTRA
ncbi:hypothetical protein Moror_3996 [Moniliophthora roreri MCA 2997]|uniref:Uncharacterized protein n=1 Tax=Moniliophthora roreri (strain MCA 2997) TaxID=1381753 RepID=V2X7T8_MONRO|nr:hypothetical protein Moror_3996 [Moniliophthora roreri MCA 2997]